MKPHIYLAGGVWSCSLSRHGIIGHGTSPLGAYISWQIYKQSLNSPIIRAPAFGKWL